VIGSDKPEKYDACPYCLTEITLEKDLKPIGDHEKKEGIEMEEKETWKIEGSQTEGLQKTGECHHYMGYLSQRSSKEKIPEECILCQNIVQCMLKNVTG
jgi:hypothetical protein